MMMRGLTTTPSHKRLKSSIYLGFLLLSSLTMLKGLLALPSKSLSTRVVASRLLNDRINVNRSFSQISATTPNNEWSAKGLSQQDLLYKDECILVNESDEIIGHDNKFNCHRFTQAFPQAKLHRAFSVFLFNNENQLLLQKRASIKITFPSVWTNTCCSHPLYGFHPNEVDDDQKLILSGEIPGIRAAAIRKLEHELGIPKELINPQDFHYLTRLLYKAKDHTTIDTKTGEAWGEAEVDYILFLRGNYPIKPNPEEIDEVKYVTLPEFQQMIHPSQGLKWSPWFQIIASHFLTNWWKHLDQVFTTKQFTDYHTIHKL